MLGFFFFYFSHKVFISNNSQQIKITLYCSSDVLSQQYYIPPNQEDALKFVLPHTIRDVWNQLTPYSKSTHTAFVKSFLRVVMLTMRYMECIFVMAK